MKTNKATRSKSWNPKSWILMTIKRRSRMIKIKSQKIRRRIRPNKVIKKMKRRRNRLMMVLLRSRLPRNTGIVLRKILHVNP